MSFYFDAISDLQEMAKGADLSGLRSQRYPDWENQNFVDLLHDLGEELE